jgi:hypothetical protein
LAGALAIVLGVAALLLPVFDLTAEGRILHWHVSQPGFRQGAVELLALGALLWLALSIKRAWAAWIAVIPCLLYLRRHHVDLPALMALVYLEMLVAMGALMHQWAERNTTRRISDPLRRLMIGIVAWILLAVVLSLLGLGRPVDLKIAAAVLVLPVFAFARTPPMIVGAWRALRRQQGIDLAIAVAFVLVALGWLARSNQLHSYDPLWYGLRPEQVLAPVRSFFDATGLVSPVHYFPKLYELLIAPLSAMRDFSYPLAFGVMLLGMLALLIHRDGRMLGLDRRMAMACALAVTTIPAIANTAVSPKPDLLAALFVLMALWLGWHAVRRRETGPLLWMLAAIALASACKLTSPPYAAAVVLGTGLAALLMQRKRQWQEPARSDLIVFVLALTATVAIHARTWWLTGLPTIAPEFLVQLWPKLGFRLVEPVGSLNWLSKQDWHDLPMLTYEMLLAPSGLGHLIISWTGNIWLWLPVAALLFWLAPAGQPGNRASLAPAVWALKTPTLLVGTTLAIGIAHLTRGGDGNYLMVPVAIATLSGALLASRATIANPGARAIVLSMLLLASAMQFAYSLANAQWAEPGTRAWDTHFDRSTFDTKHRRFAELRRAGLEDIAAQLAQHPAGYRVIGYVPGDSDGHWLPARFESLATISYSRPAYVTSAQGMQHFLDLTCIQAVLFPLDPALWSDLPPETIRLLPEIRTIPGSTRFIGQRYELITLPVRPDCSQRFRIDN